MPNLTVASASIVFTAHNEEEGTTSCRNVEQNNPLKYYRVISSISTQCSMDEILGPKINLILVNRIYRAVR